MIDECDAVGAMIIIRENLSTWRMPAPMCPPKILYDLTWK
jgi:hypothetical protein